MKASGPLTRSKTVPGMWFSDAKESVVYLGHAVPLNFVWEDIHWLPVLNTFSSRSQCLCISKLSWKCLVSSLSADSFLLLH